VKLDSGPLPASWKSGLVDYGTPSLSLSGTTRARVAALERCFPTAATWKK